MFTEIEQQKLDYILSKLNNNEIEILRTHFTKPKQSRIANRSTFTPEEDDKLRNLVSIYGEKNWVKIASLIPNRTTRQCRERYRHYLSPNIVNGKWTNSEDKLLMEKYNEYGPKWVTIAKFFKTRTDINVKNRWIVLMRKSVSLKYSNTSSPVLKEKSEAPVQQQNSIPKECSNIPEEQNNLVSENPYVFDEFEEFNDLVNDIEFTLF